MTDDDDDDDDESGLEVTDELHTVCHLCGGAQTIANPVMAVIGGVPRTIDNGRACMACDGVGRLPGFALPM